MACQDRVPPRFLAAYNVIPNHLKVTSEYKTIWKYSLVGNVSLASKWQEFKDQHVSSDLGLFSAPHDRDYHFYNCHIQLAPQMTQRNRSSFRYSMAAGPGIDNLGHLPIPNK